MIDNNTIVKTLLMSASFSWILWSSKKQSDKRRISLRQEATELRKRANRDDKRQSDKTVIIARKEAKEMYEVAKPDRDSYTQHYRPLSIENMSKHVTIETERRQRVTRAYFIKWRSLLSVSVSATGIQPIRAGLTSSPCIEGIVLRRENGAPRQLEHPWHFTTCDHGGVTNQRIQSLPKPPSTLRRAMLKYYGYATKPYVQYDSNAQDGDIGSHWMHGLKGRCIITGITGFERQISTMYLLPQQGLHPAEVKRWARVFNFDDVHDLCNLIPICKGIENLFYQGKVCIIFDSIEVLFRLKVLYEDAKDNVVFEGWNSVNDVVTIGQYDGRVFEFPEGKLPHTQILSLHARAAYAHAKMMGWIEQDVALPEDVGSPLKNDVLDCINMVSFATFDGAELSC